MVSHSEIKPGPANWIEAEFIRAQLSCFTIAFATWVLLRFVFLLKSLCCAVLQIDEMSRIDAKRKVHLGLPSATTAGSAPKRAKGRRCRVRLLYCCGPQTAKDTIHSNKARNRLCRCAACHHLSSISDSDYTWRVSGKRKSGRDHH